MKPAIVLAAILPISWAAGATFSNPVVYEDFADNDVSVGPDGLFYFSASNMHYSPGAPILRSYDLANWELIGHSVPSLDFGERYNLTGGQAYRGGTWASTMRYRESNGLWYWIGCVDFWYTYIYTSKSPTGPWTRSAQLPGGTCYYDCGLLVDDDDTMYVVYGATDVKVAQLAADGLSEVKSQGVFSASDVGQDGIEGNRMYKRNGNYYILNDHPGDNTYIWKSSSPWGPYASKILVQNIQSPVSGGGAPHQGSLVKTADDDWYYMSFTWAYPAGRMPVLGPVTWGSDDFPVFVDGSNGGWGVSYPLPLPAHPLPSWTGTDAFRGTSLGPAWEWNHNPDPSKYAVNNGLTLSAATVTDDLYAARNTLTHRIHGEFPVGTVAIDFSNLADGDRAGLAAFRDRSASIGVHRDGDTYTIQVVHGMTQDESTWATTSKGTTVATAPVPGGAKKVWLRAALDARASGTKAANFSYSFDGDEFEQLGRPYTMWTNWAYFMGYRFGIFNYATKKLGGSVAVSSFSSA
ncbi:Glycoside hydrolase family 43 [Macrophomina phaseolina MS6]|uniref:Glycoside hydrolase family 43 n=1 Tax=Macrophomina phaseolina (strain MS6) TaxID=1126212 RepID=K2RHU9_MACPH|nr:Glycoside hydrolase family 43 [Macrophomina phaseolina MS6]